MDRPDRRMKESAFNPSSTKSNGSGRSGLWAAGLGWLDDVPCPID